MTNAPPIIVTWAGQDIKVTCPSCHWSVEDLDKVGQARREARTHVRHTGHKPMISVVNREEWSYEDMGVHTDSST